MLVSGAPTGNWRESGERGCGQAGRGHWSPGYLRLCIINIFMWMEISTPNFHNTRSWHNGNGKPFSKLFAVVCLEILKRKGHSKCLGQ